MEQAYYQPLLLLYYWCSKSFWRRQAEVVQLLIEMLYFIHFRWKKHKVWYKIPWSWRETCFQYIESLKRSRRVKWHYEPHILWMFFLHISLSGLLTPSSQPRQLPFRSSVLHGGLLQVFPCHIYCAKDLSTVQHLCHDTELRPVAVHYRNRVTWLCLLSCMLPSCTRGCLKNRGLSFGHSFCLWFRTKLWTLCWCWVVEESTCRVALTFASCMSCSIGYVGLC